MTTGFVLLLTIVSHGNLAVTAVDFNSKKACESVQEFYDGLQRGLEKTAIDTGTKSETTITTFCASKGLLVRF